MWCLATCAPTLSTSSSTFSTGCTDTITRWPWWGRNLIYLISYMTIGGWRKWLDWHLLEILFYQKSIFKSDINLIEYLVLVTMHSLSKKELPILQKWRDRGHEKNFFEEIIQRRSFYWCRFFVHFLSIDAPCEGEDEIKGVKGVVCPLNHCTRQKIHQQIKYERMVPWISHQEQVSKNQKPEVFQIKL